ncbi:MAG: hypothetical protein AAFQ89_13185 [Cyanobacteria bacterium J06626_18]
MNGNDGSRQFFEHEQSGDDRLFVEVPADRLSPYPDKIPYGYDPMGEIYLRGRASRNIASGGIPWWVLIVGWIFLTGSVLLILMAALTAYPAFLAHLFFPAIFLLILWRGTSAKLDRGTHRRRGSRW